MVFDLLLTNNSLAIREFSVHLNFSYNVIFMAIKNNFYKCNHIVIWCNFWKQCVKISSPKVRVRGLPSFIVYWLRQLRAGREGRIHFTPCLNILMYNIVYTKIAFQCCEFTNLHMNPRNRQRTKSWDTLVR